MHGIVGPILRRLEARARQDLVESIQVYMASLGKIADGSVRFQSIPEVIELKNMTTAFLRKGGMSRVAAFREMCETEASDINARSSFPK